MHEHCRLPVHSVPVAVQGLPIPFSLPALGGQPGGISGREKLLWASLGEAASCCPPVLLVWLQAIARREARITCLGRIIFTPSV